MKEREELLIFGIKIRGHAPGPGAPMRRRISAVGADGPGADVKKRRCEKWRLKSRS
jgi:hypothetical protein